MKKKKSALKIKMKNLKKFLEEEFFNCFTLLSIFQNKGVQKELIFIYIRNQKNVKQ